MSAEAAVTGDAWQPLREITEECGHDSWAPHQQKHTIVANHCEEGAFLCGARTAWAQRGQHPIVPPPPL